MNQECCIQFPDGSFLQHIKGTECDEEYKEGKQWKRTSDFNDALVWSNTEVCKAYAPSGGSVVLVSQVGWKSMLAKRTR